MTAQEVASDALPTNSSRNQSCTASNVVHTGKTMSADMKCTGDFQGTGHIEITYDSDAHYAGEVKMNGVANGHPMTQDQKMEGTWVAVTRLRADCLPTLICMIEEVGIAVFLWDAAI